MSNTRITKLLKQYGEDPIELFLSNDFFETESEEEINYSHFGNERNESDEMVLTTPVLEACHLIKASPNLEESSNQIEDVVWQATEEDLNAAKNVFTEGTFEFLREQSKKLNIAGYLETVIRGFKDSTDLKLKIECANLLYRIFHKCVECKMLETTLTSYDQQPIDFTELQITNKSFESSQSNSDNINVTTTTTNSVNSNLENGVVHYNDEENFSSPINFIDLTQQSHSSDFAHSSVIEQLVTNASPSTYESENVKDAEQNIHQELSQVHEQIQILKSKHTSFTKGKTILDDDDVSTLMNLFVKNSPNQSKRSREETRFCDNCSASLFKHPAKAAKVHQNKDNDKPAHQYASVTCHH